MKLVVLTAPSGAGKTTLAKRIIKHVEGLQFSVSATTRAKRVGEIDGVDYFFLSVDEFQSEIDAGAFVEYEEVYPGRYYGTLWRELERFATSSAVLLDIDVEGALTIKKRYGTRALTIFIRPPSLATLESRLAARATDSASEISIRLRKAERELALAHLFDEVIVNDDLETACRETIAAIRAFSAT